MHTTHRRTALLPALILVAASAPLLGAATAHADDARRAPTCQGQKATIVGTAQNDTIRGTKKRDVIVGLAGRDTIHGLGGNDLICGGPGDDDLYGGSGNDVLRGGRGADRLLGGSGDDHLYGDQHALRGPSWDATSVGNLYQPGPGDDVVHLADLQHVAQAEDAQGDVFSFVEADGVHVDMEKLTVRGEGRDRIALPRRPKVWYPLARQNIQIVGSRGDDVVRAAGADVLPGPGNDRVVMKSSRSSPGSVSETTRSAYVSPIGARRSTTVAPKAWTEQGSGSDTYQGSLYLIHLRDGADRVVGDQYEQEVVLNRPDAGIKLSLGAGADDVTLRGSGRYGHLDMGAGRNSLTVGRGHHDHWVVNLRTGSWVRNGTREFTTRGHVLSTALDTTGPVEFTGTKREDELSLSTPQWLRASLGGQNDWIWLDDLQQPGNSSLDGGAGYDTLSPGSLDVDGIGHLTGFEEFE